VSSLLICSAIPCRQSYLKKPCSVPDLFTDNDTYPVDGGDNFLYFIHKKSIFSSNPLICECSLFDVFNASRMSRAALFCLRACLLALLCLNCELICNKLCLFQHCFCCQFLHIGWIAILPECALDNHLQFSSHTLFNCPVY